MSVHVCKTYFRTPCVGTPVLAHGELLCLEIPRVLANKLTLGPVAVDKYFAH